MSELDKAQVENFVAQHGEAYRTVIEDAVRWCEETKYPGDRESLVYMAVHRERCKFGACVP